MLLLSICLIRVISYLLHPNHVARFHIRPQVRCCLKDEQVFRLRHQPVEYLSRRSFWQSRLWWSSSSKDSGGWGFVASPVPLIRRSLRSDYTHLYRRIAIVYIRSLMFSAPKTMLLLLPQLQRFIVRVGRASCSICSRRLFDKKDFFSQTSYLKWNALWFFKIRYANKNRLFIWTTQPDFLLPYSFTFSSRNTPSELTINK